MTAETGTTPDEDPARRGGSIGAGLVPDEETEGAAIAAEAVSADPDEGLTQPGGVSGDAGQR